MNRYTFTFTGREKGAIGAFSEFTKTIDAEDENSARVTLYDTHEHLHNLTVKTVPIQTRTTQAITTRVLSCTNNKPARIKAECARGAIVISYHNPVLDSANFGAASRDDSRHIACAQQLVNRFIAEDLKEYGTPADKNPWNAPRFAGCVKSGDYVHVFVS